MKGRARLLRKRLLLAAGSVLVFVLPLGAAELALRWTGYVEPPPPWVREHYDRSLSLLAACDPKPVRTGKLVYRDAQLTPERVIVVGESSAGILARPLAMLGQGCGFEVVDCAQGGSSLEHLERRFAQALELRPDAILLLFGHNLPIVFPTDRRRVTMEYAASHSRLVRWLVGPPRPRAPPMKDEVRLAAFERFLTDAAVTARHRGVRLTLATPLGNPWHAPSSPSGKVDELLARARYLFATRRRAQAVLVLQETGDAAALFERAVLLEQDGDPETVRALLADSLALSGTQTNRAPPEVYDVIRRVARQQGLTLVDGDRLSRDWYGPVLDWSHFVDACHPTQDVFARFGRAVLEHHVLPVQPETCAPPQIDAAGPDPVLLMLEGVLALDPEDATHHAWSRSVAVAVPQWLNARPEVDGLIFDWLAQPSTQRAPASHRSRVMAALAHGFTRAGRPDRASALQAQAPAPEGPEVAGEWALWLLSQERATEARALLAPFAAHSPASWIVAWMDEFDAPSP